MLPTYSHEVIARSYDETLPKCMKWTFLKESKKLNFYVLLLGIGMSEDIVRFV